MLCALLLPTLFAQTPPVPQAVKPLVAAPGDVDSVDHIVAALYDVISGPAGQKRNWDRMRSLFAPGASMGAMVPTRSGGLREMDFSVDRYVAMDDDYMTKTGFFEHELARKQERFGHIVHVWSTYESRNKLEDPKPFERGINSIQLTNDGKRWWVRTILWEGESKDLKLPDKYLK
jgi:hypothetical protein